MKTQKEAVYSVVKSVCAEHNISHEDFTLLEGFSKDMREKAISILCTGFENGQIELKSPQKEMKNYVGGLLSNWLRKDKRFNGGVKYEPANPGARTGSQDPMVKNLRILLSTLPEGSDAYNATEARIEKRVNELKAAKSATRVKEIDFDSIPDDIKALL